MKRDPCCVTIRPLGTHVVLCPYRTDVRLCQQTSITTKPIASRCRTTDRTESPEDEERGGTCIRPGIPASDARTTKQTTE